MPESGSNSLLDPAVLSRLMRQPVVSRFPMEGTVSGHHKSPHRGSSVEFAEYRNYVPGDDIRRLDWRVFGRTDRFFMKEFEADTNLRCYFVVDASGSMGFTGQHGSKLDYARRVAAALAYLLIQQGDAAGAHCVGEGRTEDIPAKRTPSHLQLILDKLEALKPLGETRLVSALHEVAEKVRRRALIVILSDFFCELPPLLDALQHLRFQKHDVAVFQLLDRMETEFQFDRPVRFQDLESAFNMVTEPPVIRQQYLREFNAHNEALRRACHEFNADYRQVITDQSYEKVLADWLTERARVGAR